MLYTYVVGFIWRGQPAIGKRAIIKQAGLSHVRDLQALAESSDTCKMDAAVKVPNKLQSPNVDESSSVGTCFGSAAVPGEISVFRTRVNIWIAI